MSESSFVKLLPVLCGVLLFGCGRDETGSVTCRITLDGRPLGAATVSFIAAEADLPPLLGTTDDNGEVVLAQAAGGPVAPGK